MEAIVQRSAGLDVHKKIIVVTILLEQPDGSVKEETREYGTTYKACEGLAGWLLSNEIQLSVMESTGIYWVRHEVAKQTVAADSHLHATYCSVSSSLPEHAIGVI